MAKGHMAAHGHGHGHQGHHGHHGHQGHLAVVVKKRGGKVEHEKEEHEKRRARGGRTEPSEGKRPMEDERTEELEAEEKKGHKRGGEVKGHHPKMRMDRRARGGRMTPKEPFSGADGAEPAYARSHAPSHSEAMGKDVRP